jgi:hypothetical protein
MDLYIYFYFGSASVGDCASPYFLESTVAIQKAVKDAECSNREELCKRNDKETLEKMHAKKGRKLLKDSDDEMEECGPTTSFGQAYGKQLELEEVRVETERSREQRENTQYLISMLQGLIAQATTPQEKSEYEAEVVFLMRQAVNSQTEWNDLWQLGTVLARWCFWKRTGVKRLCRVQLQLPTVRGGKVYLVKDPACDTKELAEASVG